MTSSKRDACVVGMQAVARELRRRATTWTWRGEMGPDTMRRLTYCHFDHGETRTRVMFTRDAGMHESGWIRNPDYDRCFHLSLSPFPHDVLIGVVPVLDFRPEIERLWVEAFYGEDAHLTWREGPKTPEGRGREVAHWRLFADAHWQPILPRGEVYHSLFTPPDWRSWSQVHAEDNGPVIDSPLDPT